MPLFVVFILLASSGPSLAASQTATAAGRAQVNAGRRALEANRFLEAVRLLTKVVAATPSDGEAHQLLGRAYWADDRAMSISADKAVEAFAAAVSIDPDARTAWGKAALEQLAVSAVRSERLDRARSAYTRLLSVETRPELIAQYRTQIDEIDLDLGTYRATPATGRGPTGEVVGPVGPLKMRTNQWFEKGRHTQDPVKAEAYYRRAVVADPAMWQAPLNLGIALARQREFGEALAPLADAAARWRAANPGAPEHLRAHLWRLIAFLELGRVDDAAREVGILVKLPERDRWVTLYVLRYLVAAGRAPDAVKGIEAIAADNPENVEVLYAQALAYHAVGRTREAVATIEKAIASIPEGHLVFGRWVDPLSRLVRDWRRPGAGR